MKNWITLCCSILVPAFVLMGSLNSTSARPQYKKAFIKEYTKPDSSNEADKKFAELVDKANCNVCHIGMNRKNRNAYGQELQKILAKNEKDAKKVADALKKVGDMHSDPKDDKSPTYKQRIDQGMLPVEPKK